MRGQITLDGNAFANYSLQPDTFKQYVLRREHALFFGNTPEDAKTHYRDTVLEDLPITEKEWVDHCVAQI